MIFALLKLLLTYSCNNCQTSGQSQEQNEQNLFQQLGGEKALSKVVDDFYDIMLQDNRVAHYFKNTNMAHQRAQQKAFLRTALGNQGSDNVYKGKNMLDAHKGMNITEEAYMATVENLVNALKKNSVPQNLIDQLGPIVLSLKDDIVEQPQGKQTLLDKIGGVEKLNAAVDIFYENLLKDERTSHYFKNTNMVHQVKQQKSFLRTAFGNSTTDQVYQGQNMFDAHKNLGITNEAFDVTAQILVESLVKVGVKKELFAEIAPIVESLRSDVVQAKEQTLLEQIGGVGALSTAVDMFYDTMLVDPRTKHFFQNTNMVHQRSQQKAFLQTVLGNQGSDNVYQGQNMLDAHKGLGVTNEAYNATVENLVNTLIKLNIKQEIIEKLAPILESLRADIVEK